MIHVNKKNEIYDMIGERTGSRDKAYEYRIVSGRTIVITYSMRSDYSVNKNDR